VRPTLDVVAEHARGDLTAEIRMHGLLSNPKFELRSIPEFPQDEIISRILFGKSTATITPLQAAQLGLAVASMDGSGSGKSITDRMSDSLGVDTVEFRESGTEGAGGAAELVAGKYFSEDLYVEFNQSLNTRGGSIRVQYEITPNFSVETETGSRMRPGIGLNWKMDY
jgi:translocation and assembly module TamB